MIAVDHHSTNNEQNEGNEQTFTSGCEGQPSVGICSFNSFCSLFVSRKPTDEPRPGGNLQVLRSRALLEAWLWACAAAGAPCHRVNPAPSSIHPTHGWAPSPPWSFITRRKQMTADFSMDLDVGQGDTGPWLTWHAAPTRDGTHAAGTWSVKDNAGRATVNLTPGFVFDWTSSKTGWIQSGGTSGVAPRKQWNASRSKFERQPGDDYKRAMHAPIAYILNGSPTFAVWEQNSVAAWMGYCDLMALLKAAAPGELPKLPLVSFTGHRQVRLGNGVTLVPIVKLLRFVPRPLCLPDEDITVQPSGDAWGAPSSSAPPASVWSGGNGTAGHAVSPTTATAPSGGETLIDDEIPW
jgi:hypothetical protein